MGIWEIGESWGRGVWVVGPAGRASDFWVSVCGERVRRAPCSAEIGIGSSEGEKSGPSLRSGSVVTCCGRGTQQRAPPPPPTPPRYDRCAAPIHRTPTLAQHTHNSALATILLRQQFSPRTDSLLIILSFYVLYLFVLLTALDSRQNGYFQH